MHYSLILYTLGMFFNAFAILLVLPFIVALLYGEEISRIFLFCIFSIFALGTLCVFFSQSKQRLALTAKDGVLLVSCIWCMLTIVAALPYSLSGILSFTDAFFESASGLTTTGASIIQNVEILPRSLLFWRAFTQWIGGIGIVVFSIVLLPFTGKNTLQVFNAEATGVTHNKLRPQLKDMAIFLWKGYALLSVFCFLSLLLTGMDVFAALTYAFTTVSTGGFSISNTSAALLSPIQQWILIIFMFTASINFALLFSIQTRNDILKLICNTEFKLFCRIILFSTFCIILSMFFMDTPLIHESIETILRTVLFQVITIITTTGFYSENYVLWPQCALAIILFLTFVGGCAGSTAGGFKVIRLYILKQLTALGFVKKLYPTAIRSVKINDIPLHEDVFLSVAIFFILYATVIVTGTFILTACNIDVLTAFSAILTALGNVGPGLGSVGPIDNFSHLPTLAKYTISFCMIIGRLEIYTVLILLYPLFWKK